MTQIFLISCWRCRRQELEELAGEMGHTGKLTRRVLLEKMLPELAAFTGHKNGEEYQDIVSGVLEYAAQSAGIDRYSIYSLSKLAKQIRKAEPALDFNKNQELPALAVRKLHKNAVLSKAAAVMLRNMRF